MTVCSLGMLQQMFTEPYAKLELQKIPSFGRLVLAMNLD